MRKFIKYNCKLCNKDFERRADTKNSGYCKKCSKIGKYNEKIINKKFGKLLVIKFLKIEKNKSKWLCECDCGNTKEVLLSQLNRGTLSCGCIKKEQITKFNIHHSGKNSFRYNHNKTDDERISHHSFYKYSNWSKIVKERDKYTCQKCKKIGSNLVAHHINSFDIFTELRDILDNGITLCVKCHKEFHKKYGYGKNTKKQLIEFFN